MITATQIRVGNILNLEGDLYKVLKVDHITPGKGNAVVQTDIRNVKTGVKTNKRFRSAETVERAVLAQKEMEFLYEDGGRYHFMNSENYEQIEIDQETLGNATHYLQPNTKVVVEFHEETPLGVELPNSMELKIAETEPPMKGATASKGNKQARLENGVTIKVPQFLKIGDLVKVNPSTNEYLERVS